MNIKKTETTTQYYDESWKLHREDGPAFESIYGEKIWYQNGRFHREDGPARIYPNGDMEWYFHGKFHREDGPAKIYSNGKTQLYFLNDKRYWSMEDYLNDVKIIKIKRLSETLNKDLFKKELLINKPKI